QTADPPAGAGPRSGLAAGNLLLPADAGAGALLVAGAVAHGGGVARLGYRPGRGRPPHVPAALGRRCRPPPPWLNRTTTIISTITATAGTITAGVASSGRCSPATGTTRPARSTRPSSRANGACGRCGSR